MSQRPLLAQSRGGSSQDDLLSSCRHSAPSKTTRPHSGQTPRSSSPAPLAGLPAELESCVGTLHSAQAGPETGWRVDEGVRGRGPPGVRAEIIQEPLCPHCSCVMLTLLPWGDQKVPSWGNGLGVIPWPHPQRKGFSRVGARLRLPPLFLGPWGPRSPSHHAEVPRLSLGTCSSFLHRAWPGRVPEAHSLSRSCHFSSASLFLLSASYTPQRLRRKAWLLLRPRLKPVDRTQVCWWRVCLPSWVPQACPRACNGIRGRRLGSLAGEILVLGA